MTMWTLRWGCPWGHIEQWWTTTDEEPAGLQHWCDFQGPYGVQEILAKWQPEEVER